MTLRTLLVASLGVCAAWLTSAVAASCRAECCRCAKTLTGDWGGNRSNLSDRGVTFNLDVANFYQGVARGGLDRRFAYGGHGDYVTNVDFGKLGVQEGLFLKIRAEHRFGDNVNRDTGAFLPAAMLADLPVAGDEDLVISNFLFTQAFSENFAVFFGKLDTLDGDLNAFAHGRGKRQFLNSGLVINPIAFRTIPYSTLGCGFVLLSDDGEPTFTYTLLNSRETTKTAGFDELFEDGVAMSAELRLPTDFFGMPGHQLFGGTWNNRDFVSLGQDPRVVFPDVPINQVSDSWSLYWNFDQYLRMASGGAGQGWGVFGRAGIADDDANPIDYFLSFGVGGNNPHFGGGNDTFGVGWFVSGSSDEIGPLLQAAFGPIGDGHGVELFYNREATRWLRVTPDFQILFPARQNVEPVLAVGVRAVMQL